MLYFPEFIVHIQELRMKRLIISVLVVITGISLLGCKPDADPGFAGRPKSISSFAFVTPVSAGVVIESQHTIGLSVPLNTDVTKISPTISFTGQSVSPASGTEQDFTNPVAYTVTADDATTQVYTVTVSSTEVGVVLPSIENLRWPQDKDRFLAAFKDKVGAEVLFSQGNSTVEKANVDALIAKGIKVLVICPQSGSAAAAAAAAARDAGVKVVSYDRLITGTTAVDYYVTFDSVAVGTSMGQYLVAKAAAAGGTGKPLYLYAGSSSDNNAFLFFQGSWALLQPKIADGTFVIKNSSAAVGLKDTLSLTRTQIGTIIAQISTAWDWNIATAKAHDNLAANPPAAAEQVYILGCNDGTSRAISNEFVANGVAANRFYITGQDAEIASVQYIIDGKQSMTVFKDVRTLVNDAAQAALNLVAGVTPTGTVRYDNGSKLVPSTPTATVTITATNVKAELVDSGYYPASYFIGL